MNWNRSSKGLVLLALLLVAAVAPVAATPTVSGDVPASTQVGEQQDVTFTIPSDGLYSDYDQWTLQGRTELTNVSWTVTAYDNTDAKIDQQTFTGGSFDYQVKASDGVSRVTVRLQGTTPEVSEWSYQPPQAYTFATFVESQQGGSSTVIETYDEVRPYTEDSQAARTAIENAQRAVEDAKDSGASVGDAEQLVGNAVNAYNKGNFDNAVDLAEQARSNAESAQQSSQMTQYALIGGAVLVIVLLIGGGVYWYLNNRETYDKLG